MKLKMLSSTSIPPTEANEEERRKINRAKGRNRRLTRAERPYDAGPNVANELPGPAPTPAETRVEADAAQAQPQSDSSGQKTKGRSQAEINTHCALEAYLCHKMKELVETRWKLADVRSYIPALERKIVPSRVKRFVSPYEFYLEYAAKGDGREEFFKRLQEHYSNPNHTENWQLIRGRVMRGRCYACKDSNGSWNRVRACAVDNAQKIATVFFCDDITMHEVPFSSLLELDARFTTYSAQMIRAHLYDILPKGSLEVTTWSEEACNQVKELLMGKEFDTLILTRSDEDVRAGLPDVISNVGVVLFESWTGRRNGPSAKAIEASCSINAQLVDAGFAQSIGIFAGCKHSLISEIVPETVYDMTELKRRYPLLTDKLEEVVVEDTSSFNFPVMLDGKDLDCVVRNGGRVAAPGQKEWAPLHRELNLAPVPDGKHEFLPDKFGNRLAHIKLSFISGPECIIVHLYSQMEGMYRMQQALEKASEDQPALVYGEVIQGTFIAVEMIDRNRSIWCRAVVKLLQQQTKTFKVLLVDYGNEVTIRPSQTRSLPEFFTNIPSFAHRVHMDVPGLTPCVGTGWNSDCCINFRKYTFSWEDKDPVYYLHRPEHSEWIELADFTQDIIYNAELGKWIGGPIKKILAHQSINNRKSHPMLRSLFNSVGVEIYYELMLEDSPFWHFEPLGNNLVDTGFGKYQEKPIEKLKVHTQIADSCFPIPVERSSELGPPDAGPMTPAPAPGPSSSGQSENQRSEKKAVTRVQPVDSENKIRKPRRRVRRTGSEQPVLNDVNTNHMITDWSDDEDSTDVFSGSDDDMGGKW